MSARQYDPLDHIPSPNVIRVKLAETERLAQRLRVLLAVSEQIHAQPVAAGLVAVHDREVSHASR